MMKQEQIELYNTARLNKDNIKGESLIARINNDSYILQISGVGKKADRLSLFLTYEDILKYKNHRRLETMVYRKINKVYPQKNKKSIWRAEWNDMGTIIH